MNTIERRYKNHLKDIYGYEGEVDLSEVDKNQLERTIQLLKLRFSPSQVSNLKSMLPNYERRLKVSASSYKGNMQRLEMLEENLKETLSELPRTAYGAWQKGVLKAERQISHAQTLIYKTSQTIGNLLSDIDDYGKAVLDVTLAKDTLDSSIDGLESIIKSNLGIPMSAIPDLSTDLVGYTRTGTYLAKIL